MTEHSGLRFDIYERVHLVDGLAEIKALDEVELVPHIQVVVEGDQALLRGNLWLTGRYVGAPNADGNSESYLLEHLIPVEITLPMNRVQRLEDISVEIENFDIDLLSERSLNVMGVLSLRGVELISAENIAWQEEETVFVHEVEENRPQPLSQSNSSVGQMETFSDDSSLTSKGIMLETIEEVKPETEEYENETYWVDNGELVPGNIPNEEEIFAEPVTGEPKKEMKIAFGSKAPGERDDVGRLKSLLHNYSDEKTSKSTKKDNHSDSGSDANSEISRGDELEWKNLFLVGKTSNQEFRKVRMCIVQKEETIDDIASRYRINPREIVLYNRLNGQQVAEGQVIFIP